MDGKESIVITNNVFEEYKTNHFNSQKDLKIIFFLFFGTMGYDCTKLHIIPD